MKQVYKEIIWGGETWESGAQNRIVFLSIFVLIYFLLGSIVMESLGIPFILFAIISVFVTIFAGTFVGELQGK